MERGHNWHQIATIGTLLAAPVFVLAGIASPACISVLLGAGAIELGKSVTTNLASNFAQEKLKKIQDKNVQNINHDLERAFVFAVGQCLKHAAQTCTQNQSIVSKLAGKLVDDASDPLKWSNTRARYDFLNADDNLLKLQLRDEGQARKQLWERLWTSLHKIGLSHYAGQWPAGWAASDGAPAAIFGKHFDKEFSFYFTQALKREEFKGSLVAFQSLSFKTILAAMHANHVDIIAKLNGMQNNLQSLSALERMASTIISQNADQGATLRALQRAQASATILDEYAGHRATKAVSKRIEELQASFFGRQSVFESWNQAIKNDSGSVFILEAEWGLGKSATLANWMLNAPPEFKFITHFFSVAHPNTQSLDALQTNLLRQLVPLSHDPDANIAKDPNRQGDAIASIVAKLKPKADDHVVIIIDALDEAMEKVPNAFTEIPPGVHVIVSLRQEPKQVGDKARAWRKNAKAWELPGFGLADFQDWLTLSGDGEFAQQATEMAKQLARVSENVPLLAKYLVEDLHTQRTTHTIDECHDWLRRAEPGLESYVNKQFIQLQDADQFTEPTINLFRLLVLALGPIPINMAKRITHLDPTIEQQTPALVARWWKRLRSDNQEFFTFVHPRLAKAFAQVPGLAAEMIEPKLLDECKNWASEAYALRWGVRQHLKATNPDLEWVRQTLGYAYSKKKVEAGQMTELILDYRLALENGIDES